MNEETSFVENKKCEVCGKQATGVTQDLTKRRNMMTGTVEIGAFSPPHIHFYCEEHFTFPEMVDISTPLLDALRGE